MKISLRLLSLLLLLCVVISGFAGCDILNSITGGGDNTPPANEHVHVDYVGQTKLDRNSGTLQLEVTLKSHIDGDTTHFFVPNTVDATGVMKARYLAVNTPESTGKIEEWGKAASTFTKDKLVNAHSIIVESESDKWNFDGNGRFLVWVWYQPEEGAEYRNLNLELLQNGLAVGSKSSNTIYGEAAVAATAQATVEKLYLFSDDKDPQFPYGEAQSITLKELRTNIADYYNEHDGGARVAFEGVVTYYSNHTAYVEEYDPETDMYYGIQLFDGYDPKLIQPLSQGNRVRVVGVVGVFSGTYQITDLSYNPMRPNDPANTSVISKENDVAFKETTVDEFYSKVTIEIDETPAEFDYTALAVSTSISMKNLQVIDAYTTDSANVNSDGAMTLTCRVDGRIIDVRTAVLKDSDGNIVTEDYFLGTTIDVYGIIDYFDLNNTGDGSYQIKVYSLSDIVKH